MKFLPQANVFEHLVLIWQHCSARLWALKEVRLCGKAPRFHGWPRFLLFLLFSLTARLASHSWCYAFLPCHEESLLEWSAKINPIAWVAVYWDIPLQQKINQCITSWQLYCLFVCLFFLLGISEPLAAAYYKQLLRRGCPQSPKSFPGTALWPPTSLRTHLAPQRMH